MPRFQDVDRRFGRTVSGDLNIVVDEEALEDALKNILLTRRGERYMRPNFGSSIHEALGEPRDQQTVQFLRNEVSRTLEQDERFNLKRVDVEFPENAPGARHSIVLTVIWTTPLNFSVQETEIEVSG